MQLLLAIGKALLCANDCVQFNQNKLQGGGGSGMG